MRYIGVRSSERIPTEDTDYWGSSKHLPEDVQSTHRKLILAEHPTREAAIAHEILLHKLNNVAVNDDYYNRAQQKTTGFDTAGTTRKFTDEHRRNLSISSKLHAQKPNYVNPRKGVTVSEESRRRNSASKKADTRPAFVRAPRFKPWFITDGGVTHLFYTVTKQQHAINCGVPVGTYRDLCTKSKGYKPMARGKYKGLVVGNIPTAV